MTAKISAQLLLLLLLPPLAVLLSGQTLLVQLPESATEPWLHHLLQKVLWLLFHRSVSPAVVLAVLAALAALVVLLLVLLLLGPPLLSELVPQHSVLHFHLRGLSLLSHHQSLRLLPVSGRSTAGPAWSSHLHRPAHPKDLP